MPDQPSPLLVSLPGAGALAEVRYLAASEAGRYQHVQAIIVANDQYAESALGDRELLLKKPHSIGSRSQTDIP